MQDPCHANWYQSSTSSTARLCQHHTSILQTMHSLQQGCASHHLWLALLCTPNTLRVQHSCCPRPGTVAVMERMTSLPCSPSSLGLNCTFRVPTDTAIEIIHYTSRINPAAFWTNLAAITSSPTMPLTNPRES